MKSGSKRLGDTEHSPQNRTILYDAELAELTRVAKNGGLLICCNGDDVFIRTELDKELISRGFEYFVQKSADGG